MLLRLGGKPTVDSENPRQAEAGEAGSWDAQALVALTGFAMLLALYFIARYGGQWTDIDTATITAAIRAIGETGSLTPSVGGVYPQGYGYAAVSNFVLAATGSDLAALQRIYYPLVSAFLVLPAWALYRELTGSRRAAALATLLLFLQPEFLFVVLRGSHERMLRAEMLACLWLLLRGFRYREQPRAFAVHVALFYLAAFALIATNVLFGSSLFVAIATVLAGAWFLARLGVKPLRLAGPVIDRLWLVSLIGAVLAFGFIFYIYAPALGSLQAVGTLGQKLAQLFLTTQGGSNQYSAVVGGWIGLPVYFALGIADYLLLFGSLAVWIRQGVGWLHGTRIGEKSTLNARILWLLYAAFALQGILAVFADRINYLGGNLELRAFPTFATVAVPLVAVPLARWRPGRPAALLAGVAIALLTGLALLKATNEPSLSNKWVFYTTPEIQALRWADRHSHAEAIWVGLDERLSTAYSVAVGYTSQMNRWDTYDPKPDARAFVISEITRLRSARLKDPLPAVAAENRIYDDGQAQIFRLRPRSPFQK
ncbi:MAG TPA: hypothetical protein VFZ25_05335 [Chloroflexota bacterium]|nr:hypothetical protein [Chloroflexota bacterium]